MSESLRNWTEALAFARDQHTSPTRNWEGLCQMFVRSCYAIPPVFGSAWAQWNGADPEDRHVGGSPHDAPIGSALCYKGPSPFGHIMLAGPNFANDDCGAWSNDLVRIGGIDKVIRESPTIHWGQEYLGYLTAVNNVDLHVKTNKPPKPKQDKPYTGIEKAINRLEVSMETARKQKDAEDVKVFRAEIARLKKMHDKMRRY